MATVREVHDELGNDNRYTTTLKTMQLMTEKGLLTRSERFGSHVYLSGIMPKHIEALLAHELAHIRRHDYLVNILQSVAESLLFYHPAVWWVSSHIRTEGELCCDDVAVAATGDRLTYACALADLELHRPEHLTPALAANAASLCRIASREYSAKRPTSSDLPTPGLLVSAVLIAAGSCYLWSQSADRRPSFEVASVKPDKSETGVDKIQISRETLIIVNVSLKRCIGMAYGVAEGRLFILRTLLAR
jgi:hypothetical protein